MDEEEEGERGWIEKCIRRMKNCIGLCDALVCV